MQFIHRTGSDPSRSQLENHLRIRVRKENLYADVNGTYLASELQEDATLDSIYDMASLTKLFTTVAALRQLDTGS